MASSRWKRFAFFERNTLNLPSEVLEDLLPSSGRSLSLRSFGTPPPDQLQNDSVSLVVSTAALPLASRPKKQPPDDQKETVDTKQEDNAISGMWTTLTACAAMELPSDNNDGATIRLPSQARMVDDDDAAVASASESTADGLVLAFVTSSNTDFIHCFDVTVRCNPSKANEQRHIEDLDGWRGYFSPFAGSRTKVHQSSSANRSAESRIISEHLEQDSTDGILAVAMCRNTTGRKPIHLACITATNIVVCKDPHLFLSCRRPLANLTTNESQAFTLSSPWNTSKDGHCCALDIAPGIIAVGTDKGSVHVLLFGGVRQTLRPYLVIPPPPSSGVIVAECKLSLTSAKANVFVAYQRTSEASSARSTAGVCCYEMPLPGANSTPLSAPSARHDLDGRSVPSSSLCDAALLEGFVHFTVARPDGLYTYSHTNKVDVSAIDGSKLAICLITPPIVVSKNRDMVPGKQIGSTYALVASKDSKSGRDVIDIYDATNKIVGFHMLLSPGHRAIRAAGVTTPRMRSPDGTLRAGRSSAVVITSGGSLVTLTEKITSEKVSLLVQKGLYSAAIRIAFADSSFEAADIIALYRRYAEHLYNKGDYAGSIEQYSHTIGSLEPSHVIFRFLDAPKIPFLVKYLEELRKREMTTPVHNELLRTCYLKLNDPVSAESIVAHSSRSMNTESLSSIVTSHPKDALASICTFEAPQAAEALSVHGATLARVLPRETAGLVVALCLGIYSPEELSETPITDSKKFLEFSSDERKRLCEPYPVYLFASAFMENPRMLRLILAHCNRNKCPLTPSLRRTLLELTLAEWNQAKRSGDTEAEKQRRKEAITSLTDAHSKEIGDYDALVITQLADFAEGELLLYERLQMGPMLLSRYAKDGSEKSRRQMLAMCHSDPEILADVLGHFVNIVAEQLNGVDEDDIDSDDETGEVLADIQEALSLARRQGVLPPVRIARILAGEGTGQFGGSDSIATSSDRRTVPLSVALDYVGSILDESRKEISRLKSEVEEYNQICNSMEAEVESLRRATNLITSPKALHAKEHQHSSRINIEEMYAKVRIAVEDGEKPNNKNEILREGFWREMDQTEDTFETIARFFSKGVLQ